MRDHKAPEVDRSSKPQISSQYQHTRFNNETNRIQRFNWGSIEEKLTPIHGNVVSNLSFKLKKKASLCLLIKFISSLHSK